MEFSKFFQNGFFSKKDSQIFEKFCKAPLADEVVFKVDHLTVFCKY